MKKLLLVSLLCLTTVPAITHQRECNDCCWYDGFSVVFKNGYFYPQSCTLRDIFHRCGNKGGYWVEGDLRYNFWDCFAIEASGSYFKHHGKALCGDERTTVKIPTFGLGLKYFWNICERCDSADCCRWFTDWTLFIGGGMRAFFYREFDDSPYVIRCIKKNTVGGMINGGIQTNLCDCIFLELSVDYNFKKLKFNCCNTDCCSSVTTATNTCCPSARCDLEIGGAIVGLGIGYQF